MRESLGITIIGCGDRGTQNARAWNLHKLCQVKGVYDPDSKRAQQLGKKVKARIYDSWEEAIKDTETQIVVVCTPASFHAEISIAAARAGKHIFCEKPIALTLEDGKAMQYEAEKADVHLAISYQLRHRNLYQYYRDLYQSGQLAGPIMSRFVDAREVRPKIAMHRTDANGGPVIDLAGHYFDLIRFITNAEPESVYAKGHIFGGNKQHLAGIDNLAIDCIDQIRKA